MTLDTNDNIIDAATIVTQASDLITSLMLGDGDHLAVAQCYQVVRAVEPFLAWDDVKSLRALIVELTVVEAA
jgi:hypothetical protein